MSTFEKRAFEGLGNALKAMGYTGESILNSFDMDGDSVLDYNEFRLGIAKATGQNAPDPIIKAVFGILDEDQDGYITYEEVLLLLGEKNPSLQKALETVGGKSGDDPPKLENVAPRPRSNQQKPTMILNLSSRRASESGSGSHSLGPRRGPGSDSTSGARATRTTWTGSI